MEAECHICYLRDSSVYVHESCCLGNQRHPLTYVGRRADFRDSLTSPDKSPGCTDAAPLAMYSRQAIVKSHFTICQGLLK